MQKYSHLSADERSQIEILNGKGYSQRDIALVLGRRSSTICREVKRKTSGTYIARKAHNKAYVKRKYSKYQGMKIVEDMKLEAYVTIHLKLGWSPEQVAGRMLNRQGIRKVSHTAIYSWLRSVHGRRLESELRLLKKKRKGTKSRKKVIQLEGRVFIDDRPESVDAREYFGDWEGDFIVSGRGKKAALLVLSERKSKYVLLRKVQLKTAKAVEKTLVEMISPLANFNSLTLD